MSTHYNIAKHSGVRTSSGGGGGTVVSAVGRSVWEGWDDLPGEWDPILGQIIDGQLQFKLDNQYDRIISVTTDLNEPNQDKSNVLFTVNTNSGEECEVSFRIELDGVVQDALVNIYQADPQR